MKLLFAFLRLIRSVNLVFILITQVLFQYCIIAPIFKKQGLPVVPDFWSFWIIAGSSVLIAAAGYIINDYFDINIDKINKPDKMVVEKIIHRRNAIIWHWILSFAGILLGIWASLRLDIWWIAPANFVCVILLWFYSTTFKKKLLSGNVIISLLTAWVVMVVGFSAYFKIFDGSVSLPLMKASRIIRFTFLYAGFAFIISLVREVIKDIEDMEGDERYGARTMPVRWGVHVSKVFAGTWIVVLLGAILILEIYIIQYQWWWPLIYCLLLIIIPLLIVLRKLIKASLTADFHSLSAWVKLVMLTGILSMVFFLYY